MRVFVPLDGSVSPRPLPLFLPFSFSPPSYFPFNNPSSTVHRDNIELNLGRNFAGLSKFFAFFRKFSCNAAFKTLLKNVCTSFESRRRTQRNNLRRICACNVCRKFESNVGRGFARKERRSSFPSCLVR